MRNKRACALFLFITSIPFCLAGEKPAILTDKALAAGRTMITLGGEVRAPTDEEKRQQLESFDTEEDPLQTFYLETELLKTIRLVTKKDHTENIGKTIQVTAQIKVKLNKDGTKGSGERTLIEIDSQPKDELTASLEQKLSADIDDLAKNATQEAMTMLAKTLSARVIKIIAERTNSCCLRENN